MAERDHQEESLHYLMIDVLVDFLEKEGFTVKADHVGGLRAMPASLGGYTPDIEARKGADIRLIEVETKSTIDLPDTVEQLTRLGAGCGRAYLISVVPSNGFGRFCMSTKSAASVTPGPIPPRSSKKA